MSCALLRARQRFCKERFSTTAELLSPVQIQVYARRANCQLPKCQRAARPRGEPQAPRAETHASPSPRTGRVALRLRPGAWTTKPHKKPWGSPPLRPTAAPASSASRRHRELPPHHTPSRKHPPRSRWERRICSATSSPLCAHRAQAPRSPPKPTRTRAPAPRAPPRTRAGPAAPEIAPPTESRRKSIWARP